MRRPLHPEHPTPVRAAPIAAALPEIAWSFRGLKSSLYVCSDRPKGQMQP